MNHSALTPVFTTLRISLHAVVVGLAAVIVARTLFDSEAQEQTTAIIVLTILFILVYAAAGPFRNYLQGTWRFAWLGVLTALWIALLWLTPVATFLVFPLFLLFLHLIRVPWSIAAVATTTACAIMGFAWHSGWSVGGVLGPLLGAGVALGIGLGYRALLGEARERETLIHDLVSTREQLAASERRAGMVNERTRLARELHDTVAQDLASIQLLLHAAERSIADPPTLATLQLARETAATSVVEIRRVIHELTPPALENRTLPAALGRLATSSSATSSTHITVSVEGRPRTLPMATETALLRIAQGSLANVTAHAQAHTAEITISYDDNAVCLEVVDDGIGFDTRRDTTSHTPGGFGIPAVRSRVAQLGGSVAYSSSAGAGTRVSVLLPIDSDESTLTQ